MCATDPATAIAQQRGGASRGDTDAHLPATQYMRRAYGRAKAVARAVSQLGLDLRSPVVQLWRQSQLLWSPTTRRHLATAYAPIPTCSSCLTANQPQLAITEVK